MLKSIKVIKDELLKEHTILKEIDFNNDINIEKSDDFYVNTKRGYLEFLMGSRENIGFSDFTVLLGGAKPKEKGILLMPEKCDHVNLSYERCMLLLNRSISAKQLKYMHTKVKVPEHMKFIIIFGNKYYFDIISRMHEYGSDIWNIVNSDDVKAISYYIENNRISKTITENKKKTFIEVSETTSIDRQFDLLFTESHVKSNGTLVSTNDYDFFEDGRYYICVVCDLAENKENRECAYVSGMSFGSEEGYIFIKPISINKSTVTVSAIYSGNPTIQYHMKSEDKWINILDKNEIRIEGKLVMRLRMKSGDRIHSLMLLGK